MEILKGEAGAGGPGGRTQGVMMRDDRYGINMKRFCREYEARLMAAEATEELLEEHLRMIAWVQN